MAKEGIGPADICVLGLSKFSENTAESARTLMKEVLPKSVHQFIRATEVLYAYHAAVHVDAWFSGNLFFQIGLHGNTTGPHICVFDPTIKDPYARSISSRVSLGSLSLLDPMSIHHLHNTDRVQKDTVLLQCILKYNSKKERTFIESELEKHLGVIKPSKPPF